MTIHDSRFPLENCGESCLPHAPDQEHRIVAQLILDSESNLKEGDLYYVISNRWFSRWQRYVGPIHGLYATDEQHPGPHHTYHIHAKIEERPGSIDNSNIIIEGKDNQENDPEICRSLNEGLDYVLVPQEVWKKLFDWYKGGPALPRKLISQGVENKSYRVEVYPLCLKLLDSRDNSQSIIKLSIKKQIEEKKNKGKQWNNSWCIQINGLPEAHGIRASYCCFYAYPSLQDSKNYMVLPDVNSLERIVYSNATVRELYQRVCALRGVAQGKACVWDYFGRKKNLLLPISDQTLEEKNLLMDQDILLEVQAGQCHSSEFGDAIGNQLALIPLEPSRSSTSIAGGPITSSNHSTGHTSHIYQGSSLASMDMDDRSDIYKGERNGLAGLQNLGNTCFMNSAIQCLAHTPPLIEYFLQDYSKEINMDNPLGMRGELALAFGELLRKLWSSGRDTIPPRAFKGKLARFAPQFSGYNQHDSQELLAFLLDGLHEDLNRVKQKPYIEMKDSDGRPDKEVADECWKNHMARNDSLIVDVCQGQYKSTLVCPICGKISITFDPFMYLSLPLPSTVTRTMTVTIFYGDGSALPMPYTVTVLKHGCCKDLILALGTACCLKSDEMLLLAEVYEHKIYRYLENPLEPVASIRDDEHIVAYRLRREAQKTKLEIVHRWFDKFTVDNKKNGERKFFGSPLVTYLGEDLVSGADIDQVVYKVLSPLRRAYSPGPHCIKENGTVSISKKEPSESCKIQSTDKDLMMDPKEPMEMSNCGLCFQLFLSDERSLSCKPILKDCLIKCGQLLRVYLDWSEKENSLYDVCYLRDLPEVHKTGITVKKTRQDAISLFSCLEMFLTEEPLGPDDMWYCPRCKEHRQATKKLDLWKLPEILVFHLKRFSYSRYMKNKIDTFVNFPTYDLDLTKYVKSKDGQPYVYELYALSNHYGGLGGGHYTAHAKLIDENRWYHFDDSHVSPVCESDIKSSAAYVLFYQRVRREQKLTEGEASRGFRSP